MRILNKKIIASLLIITSIISSSGCGRSNASLEVTDYGPGGVDKSSKSKITSVDPRFDENEPIDISLDWDEELSYHNDDVSVSLSIDKDYHFMAGDIKQYTMNRSSDFSESENDILYKLFGKSYKKLESISYVDGVKYMPFLYKYRNLIDTFENNKNTSLEKNQDMVDQTIYQFIGNYKPLIDSSFSETYKWIDKEDYYIHMYEGTYNKFNFGLILAYDRLSKVRYIFFKPISIDEYFPEKDIKTLELYNSTDLSGNHSTDNTCIYSEEEATNYITDFLTESLGMSEYDTELGYAYKVYSEKASPIFGAIYDTDYNNQGGSGISQLTFSDADYISTMGSYSPEFDIPVGMNYSRSDAFPRSVELLAQQKDLAAPAIESGSGFAEYIFEGRYSEETDKSPNCITDGYALYINPSYQQLFETNAGIRKLKDQPINTGVIEITSNGIFGADIIQMLNVEKIEYKELADMEKIKAEVRDTITSGKLKEFRPDLENAIIHEAEIITYIDQDALGIPAWEFTIQNDDGYLDNIRMIINASTGEFICFE